MVKPWIVADFLRRLGSRRPTAAQLADATRSIVDSDDAAAQRLYLAGGGDAVIERLIRVCGLTRTSIGLPGWWSYTELTADAARFGRCLSDGRAAGPAWTAWVLKQMRLVRGTVAEQPNGGRWGIIDALPGPVRDRVSIKNGWTLVNADRMWHLDCLAVADGWVLSVLTRYPAALGKEHGARICRDVAARLPAPR